MDAENSPRAADLSEGESAESVGPELTYARRIIHTRGSISDPLIDPLKVLQAWNSTMPLVPESAEDQTPKTTILIGADTSRFSKIRSSIQSAGLAFNLVFQSSPPKVISELETNQSIMAVILWDGFDIDSLTIIRTIRSKLSRTKLPFIVILPLDKSRSFDIEKRDDLVSEDVEDILIEPLNPKMLKVAIRNAMDSADGKTGSDPSLSVSLKAKEATIRDLRGKIRLLCSKLVTMDKEKGRRGSTDSGLTGRSSLLNEDIDRMIENVSKTSSPPFVFIDAGETPVQSLLRHTKNFNEGIYTKHHFNRIVKRLTVHLASPPGIATLKHTLSMSTIDLMSQKWVIGDFSGESSSNATDLISNQDDEVDTLPFDGEYIGDEGDLTLEPNEEYDNDSGTPPISASPLSQNVEIVSPVSPPHSAASSQTPKSESSSLKPPFPKLGSSQTNLKSSSSLLPKQPSVETPVVAPLEFPAKNEKNEDIRSLQFDNLSMSNAQLVDVVVRIFEDLTVLERFKIDVGKFKNFVVAVSEHYSLNPYHNFNHAVDVVQNTYLFFVNSKITSYFTYMDVFALSFAALCHDLDHPGVNNLYLVNTKSPKALLYNDQSVLENHHCTTAFALLEKEDINIISSFSESDKKEFRKIVC